MADTTGTAGTGLPNTGTDNSSDSSGNVWDTIANNFGDYLTGGASLLNAINGKPNTVIAPAGSGIDPKTGAIIPPKNSFASVMANPVYIILFVIVFIVVLYLIFKK